MHTPYAWKGGHLEVLQKVLIGNGTFATALTRASMANFYKQVMMLKAEDIAGCCEPAHTESAMHGSERGVVAVNQPRPIS